MHMFIQKLILNKTKRYLAEYYYFAKKNGNYADHNCLKWFKIWLLSLPDFAKVKVKFYFYKPNAF